MTVTVTWSVKGGSGTTVVACALALAAAKDADVLLVDLAGDAPAVLGIAEPPLPGAWAWLAGAEAELAACATPAAERLRLVAAGARSVAPPTARATVPDARWEALVRAAGALAAHVVVDAGTGAPPEALVELADEALLVVRPCYLALRRASLQERRPTGVVLVAEAGRALGRRDVEGVVGARVRCEVPVDPAIARCVDAGLLATRVPRALADALTPRPAA
jgi:MinD superfamily P-loop ATPase